MTCKELLYKREEDVAEKFAEIVQRRKERVMPFADLLDKIDEIRRGNRT